MQGFFAGPLDSEVRVLFYETFGALLKRLYRPLRPPVRIIAILVVMAARRIKCVRELVPGDGAEGAIAEVLRDVDVKDGELHDASWEDDFVAGRVVVGVYRGDGHAPFVPVDGFAEGGPFAGDFEAGHGERVREKCGGRDVDGKVVV